MCPFRHDGPLKFRLARFPSKCPSCKCSYPHHCGVRTKVDIRFYREAVLQHLGQCQGLACAREFWEYVVAVQEPNIGFPGETLLVAFFLSYTWHYYCKGCNAVELPREIERVISVMKYAMVKRPSNSFADFPRTVQLIQQRIDSCSDEPEQPEQQTWTPVLAPVKNKTRRLANKPLGKAGACTPDVLPTGVSGDALPTEVSRDAFKTKINLVTALTLDAPNEVSRDGMGKELEVVKQELSETKLNHAALLIALQKALLDNERLEKELSGLKEDSSCIVCMENPRRMAALPCKHHLLCTKCAETLTTHPCPMCKGHVSKYIQLVTN